MARKYHGNGKKPMKHGSHKEHGDHMSHGSHGMDKYMDMDKSGFYHPREDEGIMHNDYSAPSNLPQSSFYKMYPRGSGFDSMGINDTLSGVDEQIHGDGKGVTQYPLKGGRKY